MRTTFFTSFVLTRNKRHIKNFDIDLKTRIDYRNGVHPVEQALSVTPPPPGTTALHHERQAISAAACHGFEDITRKVVTISRRVYKSPMATDHTRNQKYDVFTALKNVKVFIS
jgi:hypothetical protein